MSTHPPTPAITFDTNVVAVSNTRVFWATLCEDIGQSMVLTPTASMEVVRRILFETEREWTKTLKTINHEQGLGWSAITVRRLATLAAQTARDWFRDTLRQQGSIYANTPRRSAEVEALEAHIDDALDDAIFSDSDGNGVRDRRIVVEAMARGYDILASNNIASIDHGMLRHWLTTCGTPKLGLTTTIVRPEHAEERLRIAYDRPMHWTATAAARASVTDPDNPQQAAKEMVTLLDRFEQRGMAELKIRIARTIEQPQALRTVLAQVARHGTSRAMRAEQAMRAAATTAVSTRAGIDIPRS